VTYEITLEHDVDFVLGLMTAEGAEGASLLGEAMPIADAVAADPDQDAEDPDEDDDAPQNDED
jgi:hypothetical protein